MDMSKLSQAQMIAGAGGILLIVSLFLSWSFGGSAFDVFSAMDIIMLLIGAAAVAYAALPALGSAQRLPPQSARILVLLGVAVFGFVFGDVLEDPYADIGAWLALIASGAIVFGAFEGAGGAGRMMRAGSGGVSSSPVPPTGSGTPAP